MFEERFQRILEDITILNRNLTKDTIERRKNKLITDKWVEKLRTITEQFRTVHKIYKGDSCKAAEDKFIADIIAKIGEKIEKVQTELRKRQVEHNNDKMGEKFELKTAGNLIPHIGNTEESIRAFIDAIELYDEFLDNEGKPQLTKYLLKVKLTQAAKLRLKTTYNSNAALITDIKEKFLVKQSIPVLSAEINSAKQENRSIEKFGRSLEELMAKLTIAQAEGNRDAEEVLAKVNEKIAISVFTNGLKNDKIKTILKAKNFSTLAEAITSAKNEESLTRTETAGMYHMNKTYRGGRRNTTNGYKNSFDRRKEGNKTYNNRNTNGNEVRQYHNRGRSQRNRGAGHGHRGRNNNWSQGRNPSNRNSPGAYFATEEQPRQEQPHTSTIQEVDFFRGPSNGGR